MGRWVRLGLVCVLMVSAPALAHYSKRTDPCGCHHQYGLRHCHPSKKTDHCEAPASKKAAHPAHSPAPDEKKAQPPKKV